MHFYSRIFGASNSGPAFCNLNKWSFSLHFRILRFQHSTCAVDTECLKENSAKMIVMYCDTERDRREGKVNADDGTELID